MKNIIQTIIILGVLQLFNSCKEDSLLLYDENISGNNIYFTTPYNSLGSNVGSANTSTHVDFGFDLPSVTDRTVNLSVQSSGPLKDVDRPFSIAIDPNSTMKEGVHYEIDRSKLIIPANKTNGSISLKILRTTDMREDTLSVRFSLLPNEHFQPSVTHRYKPNLQDSVGVLDYQVKVSDLVSAPYAWSVAPYKARLDGAFGPYSRVKLLLVFQLFDFPTNWFTAETTNSTTMSVANITFWGNYWKYWIAKEEKEGRVYYDDNGEKIWY